MPPSKKKRILIAVLSGVVVVILAAIIGPIIYARTQSAAPPPLSVTSSPTASPTGSADASGSPSAADTPSASAASDDDGTWEVSDGSEAGYRVDEVLNGQDVTVVGRTDKVSGTIEIAGNELTAAEIEVDVASVATDTDRRDTYFRSNAMQTDEHPTATFTLTKPVELPEIGAKAVKVKATGKLELAGASRPVTATIEVVRAGDSVRASGSIDVTFADWGIQAPNLGFVKVEDSGQVEFLVELEQQ